MVDRHTNHIFFSLHNNHKNPMTVQEFEYYTEEQIFALLRRIKYPVKNPNVLTKPTLDTLRELQYRCVTSVPFETLFLRTIKSRGVDITAQGVYDRVVNQRRGGWCFSQPLRLRAPQGTWLHSPVYTCMRLQAHQLH